MIEMITLLKKYSNTVHRLTGLLISMAIVCSMMPVALAEGNETETPAAIETPVPTQTAAPAATETPAPTEEITQTRLENGSFEYPTVRYSSTPGEENDCIDSGGWWCVRNKDYLEGKAKDREQPGFYWNTTAYDDAGVGKGVFELGFSGNYSGYDVEGAADGDQFAELCAEDQSSLYQNLKTDPGAVFKWSLCHAARNRDANNQTETMALFIGAKQPSPLYKKAKGIDGDNDIFMWMAYLLKQTGKINIDTDTTQEGMIPLTVYSQPDINVQTAGITTANYTDYFSLTPTAAISKEWKCWIITTHKDSGWVERKGTYDIPAGQTETTFAFTALTGKKNNKTYINEGNLLDGIKFEKQYPLRVTTTAGGTGRVYTKFDPADPDNSDKNTLSHTGEFVTAEDGTEGSVTQDHFDRYNDSTELWVRTTPKEGYTFSGAYIDGAFHWATEKEYFTELQTETGSGKTYYQKIIMDKARFIQLVYTKESTIIFDPNGGYYDGETANTEIDMNLAENSTYTAEDAIYTPDDANIPEGERNVRFVGWYIAPFPSYYDENGNESDGKGAMIAGDVKVEYFLEPASTASPEPTNTESPDSTNKRSSRYKFRSTYRYTYGTDYMKNNDHTAITPAADGLTFIAQWEYLQTARAMTLETTATKFENSMNGGTVEITRLQGAESSITGRDVTTLDNDGREVASGGGAISKGYARMKDNIVMTAVPKDGYVFRGWYENGKLISSNSTVYSYELGEGVHTIDALFRAVLQYPYLSFVSKEKKPKTTDPYFAAGTSLKVGPHPVEGYGVNEDGGTGDSQYGNTISTGFSTVQTFSGIAYDCCLWTITIPTVSEDKPLYIKFKDAPPEKLKATEVLANDKATHNGGTIYKVNEFSEQHIKLKANLPTITGEGQVVFAVALDNIYAPGAYATLDLITSSDEIGNDFTELTEDNSYTYNAGDTYNYQYYPN